MQAILDAVNSDSFIKRLAAEINRNQTQGVPRGRALSELKDTDFFVPPLPLEDNTAVLVLTTFPIDSEYCCKLIVRNKNAPMLGAQICIPKEAVAEEIQSDMPTLERDELGGNLSPGEEAHLKDLPSPYECILYSEDVHDLSQSSVINLQGETETELMRQLDQLKFNSLAFFYVTLLRINAKPKV